MTSRDKPGKGERAIGKRKGNGQEPALDAGFDRWISRQLHQMYDPVLGESLPQDLAELIAKFDERVDAPKTRRED